MTFLATICARYLASRRKPKPDVKAVARQMCIEMGKPIPKALQG